MSPTAGKFKDKFNSHIYIYICVCVCVCVCACVCACVYMYKSIISLGTKEIPDGALNAVETSRKTEKK